MFTLRSSRKFFLVLAGMFVVCQALSVSASCIDPQQNDQHNFQQCLLQANEGDADAQWRVGMAHEQGVGTATNINKAFRYHEKSANQGHPIGQFNLGRYYDEGLAVNRNAFNAVNWYRASAEQGYPPAMNALGRVYFEGRGVTKDPARALAWFKRSASLDDTDGAFNSAYAMLYAPKPHQDTAQGLAGLEALASQGHAAAMHQLGRYYSEGELVDADLALARQWYQQAADAGLDQAKVALQKLNEPPAQPKPMPISSAPAGSSPPVPFPLELPLPGSSSPTQAPAAVSTGNAYWSWLVGLVLVGIIVYMLFGNQRAERSHPVHHRQASDVSSHATSFPPAGPDEQPDAESMDLDLPEAMQDRPASSASSASPASPASPPAGDGFYDDRLIAIAKRELEINDMDIPLWKSVLNEVDGHFERAELLYVKRRVAALLEEAKQNADSPQA